MPNKNRCNWCTQDEVYQIYHDTEWGKPEHDDNKLFELLILEGAQAGLSWLTVLKKREAYQEAFDNFNPKKVATYGEKKVQELLANEGIIRNKRKITSAIQNAKVFLEIQEEFGSFDAYIWQFVDHKPIKNHFKEVSELPSTTELSTSISKDLQKRGMNFVGPTIAYAYMQAIGLVNDHTQDCFLYKK